MKEQFDKKLVEKIKDSFLNHEEPFNPQEWEKLSHAYFHPAKKKKFAYWPFLISGIAASLLLVLVFWPIGEDLQKNVQHITDSISIENEQFKKAEFPKEKEKENLAPREEKSQAEPFEKTSVPDHPKTDWIQRVISFPIENLPQKTGSGPALAEMVQELGHSMKIKQDIKENAANEKIGDLIIAHKEETQKAQEWVDGWKADERTVAGSNNEQKEGRNNMRLGVLVGPQASSNPLDGMSLGTGVMSEFSFNNRIKLDVGITYASHRMVPESSLPRESAVMDSPSPQTEMAQSLSNSPRFMGSNAELKFSGLDIPINLKYKVMDNDNSGLYLISGLSSMVYLNQQTSETFALNSYFTTSAEGDLLGFRQSVQEFTHEAVPDEGSDGFDLGRMLNLSVGYEYNLKNGTYISIEPYYKLPLGDMTFANQQFSIGGVNLRMNFKIGK